MANTDTCQHSVAYQCEDGDARKVLASWITNRNARRGQPHWKHRAYTFRQVDFAVMRFLTDLLVRRDELQSSDQLTSAWLLPYRAELRGILEDKPCAGLWRYARDRSPEDACLPVAIWLLGRTAWRGCTYELEEVGSDRVPAVRRHLARALSRVEAWPRLRELAATYPDDRRLQALFRVGQSERFTENLKRFVQHVDDSHAAEAALASRMPLWMRDELGEETPPKSASWIRQMLLSIQRWVRGAAG